MEHEDSHGREVIETIGQGTIVIDSVAQLKEAFGVITLTKDLVIPPVEWRVDGLWPEQSLGTIIGPPKIGKSWAALDLAITAVAGGEHLGRNVNRTGPVLYFLGEGHVGTMIERVDKLLASRGLGRDALNGQLYIVPVKVNLEEAATQASISNLVDAVAPALVIFDPLARYLHNADENSAKDLRPVINWWQHDLVRQRKTSVVVVHHTTKDGKTARGTGDLLGMVDVEIMLDGKAGSGQFRINVTARNTEAPEPFRVGICVDKKTATLKVDGTAAGVADAGKTKKQNEETEKIKALLRKAPWGLSIKQLADGAGFGWNKAKKLTLAAGAVQVGDSKWGFPDATRQQAS